MKTAPKPQEINGDCPPKTQETKWTVCSEILGKCNGKCAQKAWET